MKKHLSKLVLFAFALGLTFTACKKEEESNDADHAAVGGNGTIDFTVQDKSGNLRVAGANSLADATKAVVTILNEDGSATDLTNAELDIYRINGVMFIQKISLPVGNYQVDGFHFADANNDIIFSIPAEGSRLGDLVSAPLPIAFAIGNGLATSVPIEVISTENYTPTDFGLASFPVLEIPTIDFLLAVSAIGEDVVLAGEYTVSTTGVTTTNTFEAIEENVLTVKDIAAATYTLEITVDGYEAYSQGITRDDLVNLYHDAPLLVELTKSTDVTDVDGNTYKTVVIGEQTWFTENLKTTKYNDGTPIAYPGADDNVWSNNGNNGIGSYAWYDNDPVNGEIHGALYNFPAIETEKLCPTGYHVPSNEEWTVLIDGLGGNAVAGGKLKAANYWDGTDNVSFRGLPSGHRFVMGSNSYSFIGYNAQWWTSTIHDNRWGRTVSISTNSDETRRTTSYFEYGLPVRCIKD